MFGTIRMTGKYGTERKPCYRCDKIGHFPNQCRFKGAYCHACGKKGHIAPVCKSAHMRVSYHRQLQGPPISRRALAATIEEATQESVAATLEEREAAQEETNMTTGLDQKECQRREEEYR